MAEEDHDARALATSLRATMATLVAERAPQPEIAAIKQHVRRWQNLRFARTYRDLALNPRYRAAIDFFLSELYGDSDMAARDADMDRKYLHKLLRRHGIEAGEIGEDA